MANSRLAVAGADHTIYVITNDTVQKLSGHTDFINSVSWSWIEPDVLISTGGSLIH